MVRVTKLTKRNCETYIFEIRDDIFMIAYSDAQNKSRLNLTFAGIGEILSEEIAEEGGKMCFPNFSPAICKFYQYSRKTRKGILDELSPKVRELMNQSLENYIE